ncbi:type IV toxin-antitoxin system AbiEi family antitoxin [Paraburkholderia sp. C35]|uniref:type IV toxin-antitoxin system AbiEi family antitoxin n=1 Tax=Paraburkholderia sp. C35 TaxID=2126993 RepID=UPI000D693B7F|nr:type IV toxin-antitoxin system AbiEi family antitoxin [Paraburkholderia sp. C35]
MSSRIGASSITEQQILAGACAAFQISTRIYTARTVSASGSDSEADAVIRFDIDGKKLSMPVRVESRASSIGTLLASSNRLKSVRVDGRPLMMVRPYVDPGMAAQLIELGIPFLDVAGNVFIREPEATIMIVGRPRVPSAAATSTARSTTGKGLQVMFALATQQGLASEPYRKIAEMSGAALSTVNQVIDDLLARGLLAARKNGQRIFPDWQKYVDEWVSLYPTRLKPKLTLPGYSATSPDWWRTFDFSRFDTRLSGEAAADLVTQELKAVRVTIYAHRNLGAEFLKAARLRPSADGDVEVLASFWREPVDYGWDTSTTLPVVHPLLVYADLIASGDSRNLSIAKGIYERYIENFHA